MELKVSGLKKIRGHLKTGSFRAGMKNSLVNESRKDGVQIVGKRMGFCDLFTEIGNVQIIINLLEKQIANVKRFSLPSRDQRIRAKRDQDFVLFTVLCLI